MKQEVKRLTAALTILEQRGWFSQRSEATRKRLAPIAKLRHFDADEPVYLVGDAPTGIFGLVRGSLNCSFPRSDGEDYVMHRTGAGFWFGDLALLSDRPRLVSFRAAEPTTLVHLPVRDLMRILREDPSLYAEFYQLTYENFAAAFRIVSNLALPSAAKRVADKLVFEMDAWPNSDGWLPISQADLARMTAVSLPTLQRVVSRFASEGLIEKSYGKMKVLDHDGLRRVCQRDGS